MVIGLVTTYRGYDYASDRYNRQDFGLARALARLGHKVLVIRSHDSDGSAIYDSGTPEEFAEHTVKSFKFGSHGFFRPRVLNKFKLDVCIVSTDIQLMAPSIYSWCTRKKIPFWPYVGTLASTRSISSWITSIARTRNVRFYKKCECLAKTPSVKAELEALGVKRIRVFPVGIDLANLADRETVDRNSALQKYGLSPDDKVIAFVGRMEPYKQPLRALKLFKQILDVRPVKLLLVGSGSMDDEVSEMIGQLGIGNCTKLIPSVKQMEMGNVYRAADVLLNLNPNETYGMAILESLYYSTPVVAVRAPGPSYILDKGNCGVLVSSDDEAIFSALLGVLDHKIKLDDGSAMVSSHFTWDGLLCQSGLSWATAP